MALTLSLVAKHGVTPFNLLSGGITLEICQWLVRDCNVDPESSQRFDCAAVHCIGDSIEPTAWKQRMGVICCQHVG
jgi:hypothetical protein